MDDTLKNTPIIYYLIALAIVGLLAVISYIVLSAAVNGGILIRHVMDLNYRSEILNANILLEESDKCYNICTEQNGTFIFYDYKQQPPSCICNFGNYTKDIYEVK